MQALLISVLLFALFLYFLCYNYVAPKLHVSNQKSFQNKTRRSRKLKKGVIPALPQAAQPIEAFLVLDVEATCQQGSDMDFPNEIIVRITHSFVVTKPWVRRHSDLGTSCLPPAMERQYV
jgi:hypothetical protein